MGNIVKVNDTTWRVRQKENTYYLDKQVGRWWNKKWHIMYMTVNKTLFTKKLNSTLIRR